jgi:hypothetical protein
MKKSLLAIALAAVLTVPAFGQLRFDLGVIVPMTIGEIGGGEIQTNDVVGEFLQTYILPFPEGSVYYQFSVGPLKLAPGFRMFTVILQNMVWPNLMAELVLVDRFFIQAQLGGLIFLLAGLHNDEYFGKVLLPDLSVWVGFGEERRFRLGAGVIGLALPGVTTESMAFAPYLGGRISVLNNIFPDAKDAPDQGGAKE